MTNPAYLRELQETGNNVYFAAAEKDAEKHFERFIGPHLEKAYRHFRKENAILELACGHGRLAQQLMQTYSPQRLILIDINSKNLRFCAQRFDEETSVECVLTAGSDLYAVNSGSVDFVYSFDAMVHFNLPLVSLYIAEIKRVLKVGGSALVHYSNDGNGDLTSEVMGPGKRGAMNSRAMGKLLHDCRITHHEIIDWGEKSLDALVVFEKVRA